MTAHPPRCTRCGGPWCDDYDGEYSCLLCGEVLYIPVTTITAALHLRELLPADEDRPRRTRRSRKGYRPSVGRSSMEETPRRPGMGLLRRSGAIA
jgi:hypothetical protein